MAQKRKDHRHRSDKKLSARRRFLFPLQLPALVVRSDASPLFERLCLSIVGKVRCPETATYGDTVVGSSRSAGPGGGPDDVAALLPANLRVSFVLQEMENEIVSGGGVDIPAWAVWETTSSAATDESGGPFSLPAPGPGETWDVPHANLIYNAIVEDGCGNTPVFPVEFHSSVNEMEDFLSEFVEIGDFDAVDNSTLTPNGFWTFSYTIRAVGTNGGVSDFKFRGVVSVTCTNLQTA